MNIKYNPEQIQWIDQKYLTKEYAKDLAGFWTNTNTNRLYCARETPLGIGHYFLNENMKWELDYLCDSRYRRTEINEGNRGIVIEFDSTNAVIDEDNNIFVIENDMITKKIDIKNSIMFTVHDDEERNNINEYLFACVILKYAKLIAYFGNITWISIDINVLEEYRKLEL
jgi:hypothetical protein